MINNFKDLQKNLIKSNIKLNFQKNHQKIINKNRSNIIFGL